jgi:competence protein ComEA
LRKIAGLCSTPGRIYFIKMWKQFVRDYFKFTRKERIGILIMVSIILLCIISSLFFPVIHRRKTESFEKFKDEISALKSDSGNIDHENHSKPFLVNSGQYNSNAIDFHQLQKQGFSFDPNHGSPEDWEKVGVGEKIINTIRNYLNKGGRFYKPDDIRKIWGLSSVQANQIIPFLKINGNKFPIRPATYVKSNSVKSVTFPNELGPIDINLADSNDFKSLPGIGSKLSFRIINFREKLGGFYTINQVAETYFLPDSTFKKIKPFLVLNNKKLRQININTATIESLKSHPYINYSIANAIIQYRTQHGNFNNVKELKKIMSIDDQSFEKMEPYLSVK